MKYTFPGSESIVPRCRFEVKISGRTVDQLRKVEDRCDELSQLVHGRFGPNQNTPRLVFWRSRILEGADGAEMADLLAGVTFAG